MMHQSIQSRVRHDWIGEQRDPILGWSIAGDNDRRFQMTLGYDLIEIFCLSGGESRESKVIDDQQIGGQVFFHVFVPGVIGTAGQEKTEELDSLGKKDLISQAASLMSQSLSNVSFSDSCGAIKQDMFFLLDEAAVAEIPDEFRIELGVEREVKPLQGPFFFKRGPGEC